MSSITIENKTTSTQYSVLLADHETFHAPANAEQNVQSDWNAVDGDALILNKPTIPTQYTDVMAQAACPAEDLSGLVTKITGSSLVPDTEIAKIHAAGSDNQDLSALALKTEIPTTLPASDVSPWAKEAIKPSYTVTEIGAEPANANIQTHVTALHAPANADNTALNETSHADVLVDSDIGITVAAALTADQNYVTDAQIIALHGVNDVNTSSTPIAHITESVTTVHGGLLQIGTIAGTAAAGNDSRIVGAAPKDTATFTGVTTLPSTTSIGNVSAGEIACLDGVTSSVQTQIDGKMPLAGSAGQAFTVGALTQSGQALLAQTSGNVLVGTSTDNGVDKLQVNGSASFAGGLAVAQASTLRHNTNVCNMFGGANNYAAIRMGHHSSGAPFIGSGITKNDISLNYIASTDNTTAWTHNAIELGGTDGIVFKSQTYQPDGTVLTMPVIVYISPTGLTVNNNLVATALPVYADNTAAAALATGTMYRTSTGTVMIKY